MNRLGKRFNDTLKGSHVSFLNKSAFLFN